MTEAMSSPIVRVIVTGDRRWRCEDIAGRIVCALIVRYGSNLVVAHGGAPGVDTAFAEACNDQGATHEPHPAKWEIHGRAAGPLRNQQMVDAGASLCIAVHRNLKGSRGTKDCVKRCHASGIPVWLIGGDYDRPRRLTEREIIG